MKSGDNIIHSCFDGQSESLLICKVCNVFWLYQKYICFTLPKLSTLGVNLRIHDVFSHVVIFIPSMNSSPQSKPQKINTMWPLRRLNPWIDHFLPYCTLTWTFYGLRDLYRVNNKVKLLESNTIRRCIYYVPLFAPTEPAFLCVCVILLARILYLVFTSSTYIIYMRSLRWKIRHIIFYLIISSHVFNF